MLFLCLGCVCVCMCRLTTTRTRVTYWFRCILVLVVVGAAEKVLVGPGHRPASMTAPCWLTNGYLASARCELSDRLLESDQLLTRQWLSFDLFPFVTRCILLYRMLLLALGFWILLLPAWIWMMLLSLLRRITVGGSLVSWCSMGVRT